MRILAILLLSQVLLFGSNKSDSLEWNTLLQHNVDKNGLVNYAAIKDNPLFGKAVKRFESTSIDGMKKTEKLSFLINAYNAFVIQNILQHDGMKSPLDDKKFFKEKKFKLAGKVVSLDEIENEYVLKIEPALSHFGLVCGAVSCPKLIPIAYTANNVLSQLNTNAVEFINNSSKNYLDRKNKTLYLSQLFNWFKTYFIKSEGSIKNFILKYINKRDKEFIESNDISIKFTDYNWKLNSQ